MQLAGLAKFLNVPLRTVDSWLATARAQGFPPGVMAGRFRWLSGYHVYATALLTKLYKAGLPITHTAIFGAFDFAQNIPDSNAKWSLLNSDDAAVTVDAWLAFAAAQHFLRGVADAQTS